MTDGTDALVGTVGGLMGVAIMANVAGKMLQGPRPYYAPRARRPKVRRKKGYRLAWVKK